MRVLLLVDLSYQVYRASASHPMLTSRRVFTGGLYGFLSTFAKIVRETKATQAVLCLDTKPYKRSEVYPQYKQLRKGSADQELLKMFNQSMTLVKECMELVGLPLWSVPGFESDDLVAHAAIKYRHRFDKIYAASNDSDLFQLLDLYNFGIYTKNIHEVMTEEKLRKAQGLSPFEFMHLTALTGTHNDIEGIAGVGPVTAKKALKDPAFMRKLREKHAGVIDRNFELIKLPHAEFPAAETLPSNTGRFNDRALYRFCGKYDIDVTMSMVNAFQQLHQ